MALLHTLTKPLTPRKLADSRGIKSPQENIPKNPSLSDTFTNTSLDIKTEHLK